MADFLKDIIIDGQLQTNERIYTLGGIRITGGIYDQNNSIGTAGQLLTSDGTNVEWVNTSQILGTQSNVTYYDVKNTTGATISKGKVVMAVGTDGNSGHILIDEMVADGSVEPRYILGVLNEDIAHGTTGQAIYLGQIKQLNTTGQNGETWSDGTVLWCDPNSPGDLTQTEPNGPNLKIPVAIVLNAATNGKIQVRATYNEGIHDLHDTKIVNQVDGDILVWDNTTGVWFNDSTLNVNQGVGVDITGNLDVSGKGEFGNNKIRITNEGNNALLQSLDTGLILRGNNGFTTIQNGSGSNLAQFDDAQIDFWKNVDITGTLDVSGAGTLSRGVISSYAIQSSQGVDIGIGGDNDAGVIQSFASKPLFLNPVGNQVQIGSGGLNVSGAGTFSGLLTSNTGLDIPRYNNWASINNSETLGGIRFSTGNASGTLTTGLEITSGGNRITAYHPFQANVGIDVTGNITLDTANGLIVSSGNVNSFMHFDFSDVTSANATFEFGKNIGTTGKVETRFYDGAGINTIRLQHDAGLITAGEFIKSGGTSSQFLKADGSVDSTTYLSSLPTHTHSASDITSGTLSNNRLAEFIEEKYIYTSNDSNAVYMPMVKGGMYATTSSSVTGQILIKIPSYKTRMMQQFYVDIYDYSTGESMTFKISGYNYNDSSASWQNTSVVNLSDDTDRDFTVRFGADTTNSFQYVAIGETNSTWSYPQINIRDFYGGYATLESDTQGSFNISFVTTTPGSVSQTHTNNLVATDWNNIASKPSTFPPSAHNHDSDYVNVTGDTMTGNLTVGNGTADNYVRSYHSDGSYTEMRGYGLQFNRGSSYIRPTTDNTKTLFLGSNTLQWLTLSIDASTTTFNTNGSENMRITSAGNVGIGTTSPGHLLEIRGTSDALSVGDDSNTQTYMRFANSRTMVGYSGADAVIQGGSGKGIRLNVNNDSFNSGTAMYVNSSGNVGIGTTSPIGLLNTNAENAESKIIISRGGTNLNPSTPIGALEFYADYAGSPTQYAEINAYSNNLSGVRSSLDFAVKSTSGAIQTGMTVYGTSSGVNVGIGTTSPGAKLHIATSSGQEGIIINNSNGTQTFHLGHLGSNDSYFQMKNNANVVEVLFRTDGGDSYMNTGNVGIGTTSPDRKLHVYQGDSGITGYPLTGGIDIESTSISGINILSPNTGNGRIYFGSPSSYTSGAVEYVHSATLSSAHMKFRAGNAERMRIDGSGNVGIGTTSPSTKLHVYESSPLDHITIDGNNGDNRNLRFATENSTRWNIYATGTAESGSNVGSDLSFTRYSDTGAYLSNAMLIQRSTGNVGIGTTSPDALLDVNGAGVFSGGTVVSGIDTQTDVGISIARGSFIKSNNGDYLRNIIGHTTGGNIDIGQGGTSLISNITLKPGSSGNISFYTTGSEAVRFASSGNVGIGTTSPGYTLDVNGSLHSTNINIADGIYHEGDTNTYMQFHAADQWRVVTGGVERFEVNNSQAYASHSLRAPIFYDSDNTSYYLDPSSTGDSIRVAGDVVAYYSSDKRLKDNIKPIENALDKVNAISGVTFEWNDKSHKTTGKKDVGVVAQQVEEVFPEIVETRTNGYKAVDYQKLTAVLIESVKELTAKVEALEAKQCNCK